MYDYVQEQWVFTPDELENPQATNRNDQFIAFPDLVDQGIYVNRQGYSTGQYGDGSENPVTNEDAQAVLDEDCVYKIISESPGFGRNMVTAKKWRDVMCTREGKFMSFAQ